MSKNTCVLCNGDYQIAFFQDSGKHYVAICCGCRWGSLVEIESFSTYEETWENKDILLNALSSGENDRRRDENVFRVKVKR